MHHNSVGFVKPSGAIYNAYLGRTLLLPFYHHIVGFPLRHTEPIGGTTVHPHIIDVNHIVVSHLEREETAIAIIAVQCVETTPVYVSHRCEGRQRVKGRRVGGVTHGAEHQTVAVAVVKAGIEAYIQASQAVDRRLRKHKIRGAVIVRYSQLLVAAVGAAGSHTGIVACVVDKGSPSCGLFVHRIGVEVRTIRYRRKCGKRSEALWRPAGEQ